MVTATPASRAQVTSVHATVGDPAQFASAITQLLRAAPGRRMQLSALGEVYRGARPVGKFKWAVEAINGVTVIRSGGTLAAMLA